MGTDDEDCNFSTIKKRIFDDDISTDFHFEKMMTKEKYIE